MEIELNSLKNKKLKSIYSKYFPRLKNYASHIVNSNMIAEDITQETFCKLIYLDIPEDKIKSFLYTSIRNECLNYLKHLKIRDKYFEFLKQENSYHELYIDDFVPEEDKKKLFELIISEIDVLLEHFPEKIRKSFEMRKYEHLTNMEIAEVLDISISTVERNISKVGKFINTNINIEKLNYSVFFLFVLFHY